MSKYSEYDYMYACTKIAAVSGRLASPSKLRSLCDASTISELSERISELGIKPVSDESGFNTELTLNCWLSEEYESLISFLPTAVPVYVLRARYDCHNIKTAIKCRFLGINPDKIFIDCGNIKAEKYKEMAQKHDFSLLPGKLADAAKEADSLIDGTKDARSVDVIIDRACFMLMEEYANELGFMPVSTLLKLKIDFTNIISALRAMRVKSPAKAEILINDSILSGGTLPRDALKACNSPEKLISLLSEYNCTSIANMLKNGLNGGLDEVYAMLDKEFLKQTKEICSQTQLGAYPIIDYIVSLEYQVKNLRIIFSGVANKTDPDTIRERLRV